MLHVFESKTAGRSIEKKHLARVVGKNKKESIPPRLAFTYGWLIFISPVLHYPAGASKWNPIERRLFCPISKNWQGTPLRTFETVLKYIRTTTTKTGLKVRAVLVSKKYPKGVKATKEDLKKLNIKRIKANPRWGYTVSPHRKE